MAQPSFHALRAKALLQEFFRHELPPPSIVPSPAIPDPSSAAPVSPEVQLATSSDQTRLIGAGAEAVGIIGAGVAGLKAAMLLSQAGIPFEIIEASNRVGGRVFTYQFSNQPYDYFDVGPMRYPDIPPMQSTFDLFKEVGWVPGGPGRLVPYYLSSSNTIQEFNDIRVQGPPPVDVDVFHVGESYGGTIPDVYATAGSDHWLDQTFDPIVDELAKAKNEAELLALLRKLDPLSCRAYMEGARTPDQPKPQQIYPSQVVTWLETMDTGTGLFDQALSEMCLDYMDFNFPDASHKLHFPASRKSGGPSKAAAAAEWWCIDGGTERLIPAMLAKLPNPTIFLNSRVVKISRPTTDGPVSVWVNGQSNPRQYSHVICTIPLGCLRTVDLTEADLNYQQKTAIRCCHYDSSVKVGIKFKTRWWQAGENPVVGGSSSTDRYSRTIVYPSYGTATSPGVLIASYTWAQDADREAALIPQNGTMTLTVFPHFFTPSLFIPSINCFRKR